jgi:hypothetical protein
MVKHSLSLLLACISLSSYAYTNTESCSEQLFSVLTYDMKALPVVDISQPKSDKQIVLTAIEKLIASFNKRYQENIILNKKDLMLSFSGNLNTKTIFLPYNLTDYTLNQSLFFTAHELAHFLYPISKDKEIMFFKEALLNQVKSKKLSPENEAFTNGVINSNYFQHKFINHPKELFCDVKAVELLKENNINITFEEIEKAFLILDKDHYYKKNNIVFDHFSHPIYVTRLKEIEKIYHKTKYKPYGEVFNTVMQQNCLESQKNLKDLLN